MAEFIKHKECPKCGSKDNVAVYSDGGEYCWADCGYKVIGSELREEFKERDKGSGKGKKTSKGEDMSASSEFDTETKSKKAALTEEQAKEIKGNTSLKGKGFRGIRDDISTPFGVRYAYDESTGEVIEQWYPCTEFQQLTGYKIREVPKNFRSKGRTGAECELFGQFKFNRGGKYVLIQEGECMLPTTKVLTRSGWVSLKDYQGGEVMQGNGEFADPIAIVKKPYNGNLVSYVSGSYKAIYTPEHNMIRIKDGKQFKTKANDLKKKHYAVPRTVIFNELEEDDLMVRLQVMLSADFTFRKTGEILAAFKKERKINRCRELLNASGLKYIETVQSNGYGAFYIPRQDGTERFSKEFSYEDLRYARIIIDELVHWDGNSVPNRNQIEYSSKLYSNAKFIQTCAHLCGYVSTIIHRENQFGKWLKVSILFGKQVSTTQKGYTEIPYSGDVMCLTMPEGSLLISHEDSISVTGNCDALSAYQMLSDYNKGRGSDFEIAVVSPTTGAMSRKQIQNNYAFFDTFDNIILGMDNDEAGNKARDELVKYLPKGKVKIMQMRYKDANEYLMKGKEKEFIKDFYDAKKMVPVGVLPSDQLYDRLMQQAHVEKLPWPPLMGKLNDFFKGGMPLGHIINIAAATSVGKTSVVNELLYYWIFNSSHKCGIVSMELDAGQYAEALLSRHLQRKLVLIEDEKEKIEYLKRPDIMNKANELLTDEEGNPRFYLLDNRDGTVEEIQSTIEELVISCGCKVIVIDVLQDIIAALPIDEQELFLKWSKSMIKSHGITLVYINHTRKTSAGQNAADDEQSIHGSSSIIKSASVNIMLKRDKMNENPIIRNKTEILVHKNRIFGITGPAGSMYYDNETHTLHEFDSWCEDHGVTEF